MKQDTFRNRYIIKLSSSIAIAVLNVIVQLVLPRAFTVEEYGFYNYNLNVFTSVVILLNLSTSNAMISKFAKRNNEIGLLLFYLKIYLIEIFVLSVGICILFPLAFIRDVFAGQTLLTVLLGLEVALVMKFQNDVVGIYDAMAVSRVPALFLIVLKLAVAIYVPLLYFFGRLSLNIFYTGQLVLIGIVVLVLLIIIIRFQRSKYPQKICHKTKEYLKEYYVFCRPLVVASVIAQLITIIMNWALMKWSGATEQAMFGAAWQLNTLVSFVFSPYAELSKREYAVVSEDKQRISTLYDKSLRMMLWITSYFALFIGFCANWILPVVYGDKYNNALGVTLLIMIYTVYQAAGQINGSIMIALEYTKINAILAVVGQVITFVLIFIFQIPNFLWPNGLGAIGIAIVYMGGNFLSTCIGMIVISKKINLPLRYSIGLHWVPIVVCTVLSLAINKGMEYLWSDVGNGEIMIYVLKILIAGVIYTSAIALIIMKKPTLAGISKSTIEESEARIKRMLKWRR